MADIFEQSLDRNAANHVALSPISFLRRSAMVYPQKAAIVHGDRRISYSEMLERCRRFAGALGARGIGRGDAVSVLAMNSPCLLESHYGIPMAGAVLNAINTRLDAAAIAFILEHCEAKMFIVDRALAGVAREALALTSARPVIVDYDDPEYDGPGERLGGIEYEELLASGDPDFPVELPADEWQAISLNYTSGTTGNPKGVVYHHRGAYLNSVSNAFAFGFTDSSIYLWTLPMFHCNGWTCTWAVTFAGGTHVCLRSVDPAQIFRLIAEEKVSNMCGAPIVLNMLVHAPAAAKRPFDQIVNVATGGAAPPSAVISKMETMGFNVSHLYGLTETYGPSTVCVWKPDWDALDLGGRATMLSRQGVQTAAFEDAKVFDPETFLEVAWDGAQIGEIFIRGNAVMKGYLKNPAATEAALAGGWFHTGDLAVVHPDGYIEVKDRSKDIIISGGENISSLEVEEVLYRHPDIMEAAVVARPDVKWGETPCAFVTLRAEAGEVSEADVIAYCRDHMAHFKAPKTVLFGPLPKTSTGKIQKFVLRERAAAL
ncbi:MAG: acyl-CoA synthetase [Rhodospirillales bacterium]